MLRRTAYKDRLGLTLDYCVNDLLARSVSFEDLPVQAQLAWRPPKKEDADSAPADPQLLVAERAPASADGPLPGEHEAQIEDDELIGRDEPQLLLAL